MANHSPACVERNRVNGDAELRRIARAVRVTPAHKAAAIRTGTAIARKLHSV